MKRVMRFCLAAWLVGAAAASADSITVGIAHITTTGTFFCLVDPVCSASGNSVVLGSGPGATTITFTGVSADVPMKNEFVPVSLGTFSASSDSTTFPTRVNTTQPVLGFRLSLTQATSITTTANRWMKLGPGGQTDLRLMQGSTYIAVDTGLDPGTYSRMVYTYSPEIFAIPMNGSVDLTADAAVVPEPATLTLLGSGLVGALVARRRRRVGPNR